MYVAPASGMKDLVAGVEAFSRCHSAATSRGKSFARSHALTLPMSTASKHDS